MKGLSTDEESLVEVVCGRARDKADGLRIASSSTETYWLTWAPGLGRHGQVAALIGCRWLSDEQIGEPGSANEVGYISFAIFFPVHEKQNRTRKQLETLLTRRLEMNHEVQEIHMDGVARLFIRVLCSRRFAQVRATLKA